MPNAKPTLCLNMIVKNEAHIIRELFDSVHKHIDSWVISDTGSSDGTQRLIRDYFREKNIPGELHERPWKNFGHNRNEALGLARGKADYIWVMDADDVLVGSPDFSTLTHDAYMMRYGTDFTWWRTQVFRDGKPWKYVGVVHEYPACDEAFVQEKLEGDYHIEARHLGARSRDPDKYRHDAKAIETALREEPDNTRYWFYLGQSRFSAGEWSIARDAYARRAGMGGWPEEVFYSRYRMGLCSRNLGDEARMFHELLTVFDSFPHRSEPLHALALHCMQGKRFQLGYHLAALGAAVPMPGDVLFVETDVYRWRLLDIMAVCGYYLGKQAEARELNTQLLTLAPESEHARIRRNLAFP